MFKKTTTLMFLGILLILSLAACKSSDSMVQDATVETVAAPSEPVEEVVEESPTSVSEEAVAAVSDYDYTLVETGQGNCYDGDGANITCPAEGEAFYGQDAQFTGAEFDFTDNGDGTVTDNVTDLTWQQTPDSGSYSWQEAMDYCETLSLADQDDWRAPSLKELFSISNFSQGWPYLDTTYFDLVGDDVSKAEQYWSNNYYAGSTAEGQTDAAFGVNHGTGHIKAYPALVNGPMGKHIRCVSGETYGVNQLMDNSDGTISDEATGLMWMQTDSETGMDWEAALAYAQTMNEENYLGYSDWRLPNVKELQSIVDYDYAPDATDPDNEGPAIDPMFETSQIINEAGDDDYAYYWTSTSARFQAGGDFYYAWYVAFGKAVNDEGVDFHGAGAVRFDTKEEGGPASEGGERYYNYVRLVRGGDVTETPEGNPTVDTSVSVGSAGEGGQPQGMGDAPEVPGGQPQGMPDLAVVAEALGVTEDALKDALGDPSLGQPDFTAAAEVLGITEEALMEAFEGPQG